MSTANARAEEALPGPFEPIGDAVRFEIAPAALERLSNLAKIPAHYRPTFANSITKLFAKAHRWHRMATRSVQMEAAAKELGRVAKDARKLKKNIDKLSEQARVTLGLYVLRLEQFGEAGSQEAVRNQIEDLLHSDSVGAALQKVDSLSWAIGQIESAAATEAWPKHQKANPASWKSDANRRTPYVDIFNRFVTELGEVVRACKGTLPIEQNAMGDDLEAFLRVASAYLPNEFIPQEMFHSGAGRDRGAGWRLRKLASLWSNA